MEQVVVGMADCKVSDSPGHVLTTYALGSCIGLSVYDPAAKVGGLLHFMLPDSGIDPGRGRDNPWRFADTGIPLLLERVCGKGALKRRMVAAAAGGAQMLDPGGIFDIGKRNYQALRKALWKAGIMLQAEAVGGASSRTVRLEIAGGRFLLQEGGAQRELVGPRPWKG